MKEVCLFDFGCKDKEKVKNERMKNEK